MEPLQQHPPGHCRPHVQTTADTQTHIKPDSSVGGQPSTVWDFLAWAKNAAGNSLQWVSRTTDATISTSPRPEPYKRTSCCKEWIAGTRLGRARRSSSFCRVLQPMRGSSQVLLAPLRAEPLWIIGLTGLGFGFRGRGCFGGQAWSTHPTRRTGHRTQSILPPIVCNTGPALAATDEQKRLAGQAHFPTTSTRLRRHTHSRGRRDVQTRTDSVSTHAGPAYPNSNRQANP